MYTKAGYSKARMCRDLVSKRSHLADGKEKSQQNRVENQRHVAAEEWEGVGECVDRTKTNQQRGGRLRTPGTVYSDQ